MHAQDARPEISGRSRWRLRAAAFAAAALALAPLAAEAGPSIIIDAANGRVLEQDQATRPWYPASLTKLMTVYIALSAVRDGRVTFDTPFIVSKYAASMQPSKMGFAPGTAVTLGNALKMLMVKSANDIAVTIAEGLDGSVENFAKEMNATAARLGLHESHFETPNGLPDPNHYSSARDLAIIARSIYRDFPQEAGLFDIGALRLGRMVIPNHNGILGRFPGADGMKTGFICASGFNVVVSVDRDGRHLIAVVLGSPSAKARTIKAAAMLDAALDGGYPASNVTVDQLPASSQTQPADIHKEVCGRHRVAEEDDFPVPVAGDSGNGADQTRARMLAAASGVVSAPRAGFEPVDVYVGPAPGYTGPVAKPTDMPGPSDWLAFAAMQEQEKQQTPLSEDPNAVSMKHAGKVGTAAAAAISARSHVAARHAHGKPHGRREKTHVAAKPQPQPRKAAHASPARPARHVASKAASKPKAQGSDNE